MLDREGEVVPEALVLRRDDRRPEGRGGAVGALEGEFSRLVERAAVHPLAGRCEPVHVGPHQVRNDLLAHQIPSGPKSSSGGGGGGSNSGAGGAGRGGDSFRMSSNVVEYRRRRASRCIS